jgi:hypothetical protein
MISQRTRNVIVLLVVLGLSSVLAACGSSVTQAKHDHPMASLEGMPAEVLAAPVRVQEAYQFAVANPAIAEQVPCYCGCSALGHTSSYGCYVKAVGAAGEIEYDLHAVGCGICVDITEDTMKMLDQGKSPGEIKAYVDKTYARFGPSTGP